DLPIQAGSRESREEITVHRNDAHQRVITPEVEGIGPDNGLNAARRLLDTRSRLGEGDETHRTEAETGESETTYRKVITRDVVAFGVGLKGRLARLLDRRCRTFRDVG